MRPWDTALSSIVSPDETVFLYKPARWAEYGMEYYRSNRIRSVFSEAELVQAIETQPRVLCIAEDKKLEELTRVTDVDLEVVHAIGGQTAFWIWKVK